MSELKLIETRHPNKPSEGAYTRLVGIDEHKSRLCEGISLMLDRRPIDAWLKRRHGGSLSLMNRLQGRAPIVLLSGEVGCGKSVLAQSVGTPVAKLIDKQVISYETPSDIRGSGLVGEISNRITATFEQALRRLPSRAAGLIIIDEADDLATRRSQMQAHHEDRAALNVLVKQLDKLSRVGSAVGAIIITNRPGVLDPAIRRRISTHISFRRPDNTQLAQLFTALFDEPRDKDVRKLVSVCSRQAVPFTSSDIIDRIGREAVFAAYRADEVFSMAHVMAALELTEPSPLMRKEEDSDVIG